MMDCFQDVYSLEDEKISSEFPAEAVAWIEDEGVSTTDVQATEKFSTAELTPAGVMKWLTGQKHKPLDDGSLQVSVRFNHDCAENNPSHKICYPVVGACASEITLPVRHMSTPEEFNEIFTLAFIKGQAFANA